MKFIDFLDLRKNHLAESFYIVLKRLLSSFGRIFVFFNEDIKVDSCLYYNDRRFLLLMKNKTKICSGLLACLALMPSYAAASSTTDSDTGTEILDYIEWQRKAARENALDPELAELHKEAVEQAQKKPVKPVDATKPAPVTFEGDDISYDERNGAVYAKGHVVITQTESRVLANEITGNTQTADVHIEDKAHMLQVNQPRVVLDGYKTDYNYQKKTGTMNNAKGKVEQQYITGKKLDFYPERVVIYNGTATKCSAKNPDYHTSAEKIEIWPNDKMIMHNVKFWIKNKVIATRKIYKVDFTKKNDETLPRIGYNNHDGVYISEKFEYPIAKNVDAYLDLNYYSKLSFKNVYGSTWNNGYNHAELQYGSFEDSDNNWIKKEPTLKYVYGTRKIGSSPFNYDVGMEIGRWTDSAKTSTHTKYYVDLSRDPIAFGKTLKLYTSLGYSITKESYDDSQVNSFSYNATFVKEFNKRFAIFSGYHYTQNTTANSLFNYDSEDYAKKWESGFSYRIDEHNRIVVGENYDMDSREIKDVDYYWYHDIHCAEMILRYREKRKSWQIHFEFTPW